jgi:hypothetical protein
MSTPEETNESIYKSLMPVCGANKINKMQKRMRLESDRKLERKRNHA